jgi:GH15 family glucan-1,4-alpha-glucosidase
VYQSLLVASDFAEKFGFPDDASNWTSSANKILSNSSIFFDSDRQLYRKGFLLQQDGSLVFDNTLDVSSMYGVMMFGLHTDTGDLKKTVSQIETILLDKTPSGGSPRYEYDHYFESNPAFLGNPWIVTTLWMAQYYARTGNLDKARQYVDWSMQRATQSGVLAEQINPSDNSPISVTPLVWSHAELANTILDVMKLG